MPLNSQKAMQIMLLASCIVLAACKPSKEDAAQACSKNMRQTLDACSCWIDRVERSVKPRWFEAFLLHQANPKKGDRNFENWSMGELLAYTDAILNTQTDARRACRFNPTGL